MTASEVARHFTAKKAGRGSWMAHCPSHPDRNRSLSIKEGNTCVLIKCWSGCSNDEVIKASGLSFSDLFYNSRKPAPRITSLHTHLEELRRKADIALWLSALERPQYWRGAYRSIMREYDDLRHQLYIEEAPKNVR